MNRFRLLRADEIECRISQIKENGLSILLYKTARTDANLLDEAVGAENWENDFKVVDGVLYGGIGIYDTNTERWVWKWDAGTESNTEAEKGRASDAFKRAGFKHGIGRELYTAPFIWIGADNCDIKKREKSGTLYCNDGFSVSEIEYNSKGEISKLQIANDRRNAVVYTFPRKSDFKSREYKDTAEPAASAQERVKQATTAKEAPDGYYYCENCGKAIKEIKMKNGTMISQREVAERAIGKYGRQLCVSCAKNEKQTA